MAEAKSTYYSPTGTETGEATVIGDPRQGFFEYALRVPLYRQKQALQASKKADDVYKQIKPGEAWRYFQPHINAQWGRLSEAVESSLADGSFNQALLTKHVADLKALENMSTQLQKDMDAVARQHAGDKRVRSDATEALTRKVVGDGDISSLRRAASSPINGEFFLTEKGGSKYLNRDEVINTVMENNFNDWLEAKVQEIGEGEARRKGLIEYDVKGGYKKYKKYTDVDQNGNIHIIDADELMGLGIGQIFENDPYMNRVILDDASKIASLAGRKVPNVQDRGIALENLLRGREAGRTEAIQDKRTARYHVPGSGGDSDGFGNWLFQKVQALGQDVGASGPLTPGIVGYQPGKPMKSEELPFFGPKHREDVLFQDMKLGDKVLGTTFIDKNGQLKVRTFEPDPKGYPDATKPGEILDVNVSLINAIKDLGARQKADFINAAYDAGAIDEAGNLVFKDLITDRKLDRITGRRSSDRTHAYE